MNKPGDKETSITTPPDHFVIDADEQTLWQGQPHFFSFIFSDTLLIGFSSLWAIIIGSFDYLFLKKGLSVHAIIYNAVLLTPLWLSIAEILYLAYVHRLVSFCITTKRIIVQCEKERTFLIFEQVLMMEAKKIFSPSNVMSA